MTRFWLSWWRWGWISIECRLVDRTAFILPAGRDKHSNLGNLAPLRVLAR